MEALLIGYDLYKFVDGSYPIPPTTITTNGTIKPNPEYSTWQHQDKLIFGALVGRVSYHVSNTSHLTLKNLT